jgi:hypothetical protein
MPLRDVQEAASHTDPRTTMRYDRARASLDRHATYVVVAYLAGAVPSRRPEMGVLHHLPLTNPSSSHDAESAG